MVALLAAGSLPYDMGDAGRSAPGYRGGGAGAPAEPATMTVIKAFGVNEEADMSPTQTPQRDPSVWEKFVILVQLRWRRYKLRLRRMLRRGSH